MKKNFFTINELTRSKTADILGIDNTPSVMERINLKTLIGKCLNPIREAWGNPIYVNSGFRSHALNRAVGGAKNSQHLKGEAADITAGSRNLNKALFNMIREKGFDFDQLIDERNYKWIHISYKSKETNRKEVLHL